VKKPANLKQKLWLLGLYILLLFIWFYFQLPCVLRSLTNIPCITCGLTRAWLYALHLDFRSAFLQYPMFWAVPILVLFLLYDGQLFGNRKVNFWCLGILLSGMVLIWLARIFDFLGSLMPL
jgi:hypothetical protein